MTAEPVSVAPLPYGCSQRDYDRAWLANDYVSTLTEDERNTLRYVFAALPDAEHRELEAVLSVLGLFPGSKDLRTTPRGSKRSVPCGHLHPEDCQPVDAASAT